MKVTIDIDCTPEEARRFFGLPDVSALQDKMLQEWEQKMYDAMAEMDAESLFKHWIPGGMKTFEDMQKAFWNQMGMGGMKDDKDSGDK